MEKHSKFFQKSILLLDFSSDLCSNLALLDNVLSRTFKEIKLYFITSTQITDYSYSYLEKLMTFLYHYIFEAKNKDFQFKTGIFFPFLFPNQSLTKFFEAFLIKNNSFNAIFFSDGIETPLLLKNDPRVIQIPLKTIEIKIKTPKWELSSPNYKLFSLKTLVIGGTFDYLHSGHKLFISCACLLASQTSHSILSIGLTGEEMLKKKQSPELIQPFYLRKRLLIDFLEEFHPFLEFSVVELKEPCGPTKTEDFEGMFCTKETLKGADYINNIRKELGLKELAVFTTSLVQSKEEDKISSGDIRNEILKKIDKNNEKFVIEYLKSNWFNEIEGLFKGSNIDQALVKDLSEYWLDKLMGCYLEKWREYHTVMHIYELLRLLDEMKGEINKRINVFLAIWFHDAVYWADDNKNEENSAILFKEFISEVLKVDGFKKEKELQKDAEVIYDYILFTKNHFKPIDEKYKDDKDLLYFLDFDISILGSESHNYDKYKEGIYAEYSPFFDLSVMKEKRANFLISIFSNVSPMFKTKKMQEKCEENARKNIELEIISLKNN